MLMLLMPLIMPCVSFDTGTWDKQVDGSRLINDAVTTSK